MPLFLYYFLELFSYTGAGTPEDPGGDFQMSCWIEAPDQLAALEWGYVLLGDYCRARVEHVGDDAAYDGSPIRRGEIIEDTKTLAEAADWKIPICRIGELPAWDRPWRRSNLKQ